MKFQATLLDLANIRRSRFVYGESRAVFGRAAIQYLDKALELLGSGQADCLVTAPVNKLSIRSAGFSKFQGHTEYLAEKTGVKEFAMMFVGDKVKITLVTRHVALKDVGACLSEESIGRAIYLTHAYLKKYFGIGTPRIGIAGLNPHAGENGAFGSEEIDMIIPAIRRASRSIGGISGPISPDIIFHSALDGKFDAVIALYHDQGLIPFKLLYFMDGVNLTLGLPFVRTSPDHGTAFDIAGKGVADPSSMIAAIRLACRLAAVRIR
jgi:4-hydroxythreonine-4-phosphate dehydrogenase